MKRLFRTPLLRHAAQFLGTLGVLAGFVWIVARPHAEDFVRRTLEPEIRSLAESVETVKAGQAAQARSIKEIKRGQAKTDTRIGYIEQLAKEQRDLSARILFEIRR